MLPTFSVNVDIYSKDAVKRVVEIVKSIDANSLNREWIGEAYLRAVEQNMSDNINLSSYSNACNRNTKLSKMAKPETSILNQDEYNYGYMGVTDVVADYVEDNIEDIISSLDMDYYIESFLDVREDLYFAQGYDIWRLVQLSKLDDKQAQTKLRMLMDEFEFRDLLYYILTKTACYNKLEGILC